jgi:nuclear receptor interaction protein
LPIDIAIGDDDDYDDDDDISRTLNGDDSDGDDDGTRSERNPKFSAGKDVPCTSHLKQYSGHCNCETTKDVNFYGLQDEYVVSGSDGGHFFIWEKDSGRLVNILLGDCEVVNVVQREFIHLHHCEC